MNSQEELILLIKSQLQDKNELAQLQAKHIKEQEAKLRQKEEEIQELMSILFF